MNLCTLVAKSCALLIANFCALLFTDYRDLDNEGIFGLNKQASKLVSLCWELTIT
jgi:hypothetical protein